MLRRHKAQSVLEYVLVLTAIIAVVVIFAGGFLRTKVQSGLENAATQMNNQTNKIKF